MELRYFRLHPSRLPATAATTTAAATTAAAAPLLLRLVHAEVATVKIAAVEIGDRLGGFVFVHLDETEAARSAGFAIIDHRCRMNRSERREQLLQLGIAAAPGEIPNVNLLH